jgi:hypothetical protein
LNQQRKAKGKPAIIANSYGKTNELHDPENGYYVTHSNVGPKTKKGQSIAENIGRDKARVRNTIMAADNKGDFVNEQGNSVGGSGNGDYHIGATSQARNLVPAGCATLPFDLDGQPRRNDGTGAAGAYEYIP